MTRIDVKEELEERSFVQWVKWLHPTPALGVYPLGHAPHGFYEAPFRDHFGAPFAFVDPNHFEHCLVGIRNIQWNKNSVRLGSGCGIVAQSDVEQEWAELACKRKSVREILCL
jgi:menaquinone-specific isochorismate synthase